MSRQNRSAGTPGANGSGGAGGPFDGVGGSGGGGGGGWTGGGGGAAGGAGSASTDGAGGGGGAGGQSFSVVTAGGVTTGLADDNDDGALAITYDITPPAIRTEPTLSGLVQVGSKLTCDLGTWNGSPALAVAWLRNGVPLAKATATEYVLANADAGTRSPAR